MARAPLSASFEALGDAFFRKESIYSMTWDIRDLSPYAMACAPNAGPVALLRDPAKPHLAGKQAIGKPRIYIYSSAGALLQTVVWDRDQKIIQFGFTRSESLVVVAEDGSYRLYPFKADSSVASSSLGYTQHSLGTEARDTGIIDAKIYESGMVVLLGNLVFVQVEDWPETQDAPDAEGKRPGTVTRLADANLMEAPSCWAVVPPEISSSRQPEVLLSINESLWLLDTLDCQNQHLTQGPFTHIVPSPNGRLLALLTAQEADRPAKALIMSADFSRHFSEYDLAAQCQVTNPTQMVWCGSHTILFADTDDTVVMVGPFGDVLRYYQDTTTYLISEVDGTRMISAQTCEFVQRVPESTWQIFRPGSVSPAAILYEAAEQFERKSAKADEGIRSIKADLVSAVDTCIDAAGREYDSYWQKRLLKAASFGKTFLDLYNPSDFVHMTQLLRVLNAVRYYEIGLPLTLEQYRQQPPEHLIQRLTSRGLYLLALRIAAFLSLPRGPVLRHWASAQVGQVKSKDDIEPICHTIVSRLHGQTEVSCADVAKTAWEQGQTGLATKLLDYEPQSAKQVPLLLSMKEEDGALTKALQSSDPNLIYLVLLQLRRTHGPANFFRFIDKRPDAVALFQAWARTEAVELLRDFNYQDDRRVESACLVLQESLGVQDKQARMAKVKEAAGFFGDDKERAFETKMVDEQYKLLTYQLALEKEADGRKAFFGLSVNETLTQCLIGGWPKRADKIKTDFKVPDKRFWLIKMKALVQVRDWDGLDAFVKAKKSPVGYEPLVEHLKHNGMLRQAVGYITKCEQRNRVELYVRCSEWKLAGEECKARGDRNKLVEIRQRCPNSYIAAELDALLDEMGSGY